MKKLLLPLMLGVAFIFNSALIAAPCVQWNQVKSDIEKYFAEKKNLQMLSLEKAGDAEYNTFTSKTGKYITDKDGNTIELEKKEEKCVQIAKVVFVDESKTKMTETWH